MDDSANSATTLAQAAGQATSVNILAWMKLAGAVITIAGVLALVGVIRERGAGWANALGTLGVLSGVGMSAIAVNHFVVTGLVRSGVTATDTAKVLDAFHTAGGPAAVLFMLGPIVYLLASVAASRAGLVPKAAIILGVLLRALARVAPASQGSGWSALADRIVAAWPPT